MLSQAIGLSVILGFLSSELLGLLSGGLISAGYLSLYVEQPYRLLSTVLLALLIYLALKLINKAVILYGRRRFMGAVLLSLLGTFVFEQFFYRMNVTGQDIRVVGFIVPGLMANDMMKQGVWKTLLAVFVLAFLIRMILMAGSLR